MSILDELSDVSVWERFYEYKSGLVCPDRLKRELRRFIDSRGYIPVCESIASGCDFPLPQKSIISKQSTQKKRVVYTYPDAHNRVLKLLTYIMLRRSDGLFADNLFSFRPGRTAKDAIMSLLRVRGVGEMYSYKADISNYFNSIDIERLLPLLKNAMGDDEELYAFLKRLLEEPYVLENGERIKERKGIMAGTPLASFYANLFLTELDRHFEKLGVPYCRYSDDIILFAKTREGAQGHAETVRSFLKENGLELNPDKERFSSPDEGFVFLGFSYRHGVIDIAPASLDKLKHKMRRKMRALARWRDRNGIEGERAAKAFIRIFNRKLFESVSDNELTWTYWFFPVINTTKSLNAIDRYAQDCVRRLVSGKSTKARFNVRYDYMRSLGLKSLMHEYYKNKTDDE